MKRLLSILSLLITLVPCAYAAVNGTGQTINTLPNQDANFITNMRTFLRDENAQRDDSRFPAFVVSGGISATDSDLTQNVSAVVAFVHGYRVSQALTALTYTNTRRTYVYLDSIESRATEIVASGGSGCTFLARSTRLIQVSCTASSTQPTLSVAGLAPLFYADTAAGAISTVQDLRSPSALPVLDLRMYAGDDFCLRMQSAVADLPNIIGGTIDARGIVGPQYCSVEPFNSVKNVRLLLGAYDITTATTWLITSGSVIEGNLAGLLTVITNFGNVPIIRNKTNQPASNGARDSNISIRNVRMDGNASNNNGTEFQHCIQFLAVTDARIEGNSCSNTDGDGYYVGPYSAGGINPEDIWINGNRSINNFRNGISVTGGSRFNIHNNIITTAGLIGIDIEPDGSATPDVIDVNITGNVITSCGNTYTTTAGGGIFAVDQSGSIQNVLVANNIIDSPLGGTFTAGIEFRGVVDGLISGNTINNSEGIGIGFITGGVTNERIKVIGNMIRSTALQGISWPHANPVEIINNSIISAVGSGIQVTLSVGCRIDGNTILTSSSEGMILTGTSKCIITGNHSRSNTLRGIRLISTGASHPTENLVVGNYVEDNASNGIREDASGDLNYIFGNKVRGNSASGIVVVGASTVVSHNMGWLTEGNALSAAFLITSVAVVQVDVTHGMNITPTSTQIQLSLVKDTNVNDWGAAPVLDFCNSTVCRVQVNVFDASATGGATAKILLRVN